MIRPIDNPVLVEEWRGTAIENVHRGALCAVDQLGRLVAEAGNIDAEIFPRSAIKSIQALALFDSGAAKKFALTEEELALCCSSHFGEEIHTTKVAAFLKKLGLSADDLECGAQMPSHSKTRRALVANGQSPSTLHNNCSGKHAGMLAVALALGVEPKNYVAIDHPVQQLVRKIGQEVLGHEFSLDRCGSDGCSIPTWKAPLKNFAMAFAAMAADEIKSETYGPGVSKLIDASINNPYLIAGENVFDTKAMEIFGGRLMVKVGAAGVFCGLIRNSNIGFALKCDDGNLKAAEVMVATLLLNIANPNAAESAFLMSRANVQLTNAAGRHVGELKPEIEFSQGD